MTYEVRIPEIGESVTEALIVRWMKQPGQTVGRDEPLVELETDKVTVEMPSPVSGVLAEVVAPEGETVPVGELIARIEDSGAATTATTTPAAAQTDLLAAAEPVQAPPMTRAEPPPTAVEVNEPAAAAPAEDARRILPAAQRLITEHGLDSSRIEATGKGGRVLKSDVLAHLAAREMEAAEEPVAATPQAPAPPEPTPATSDPQPAAPRPAATKLEAPGAATVTAPVGRDEERVAMTPIRRRIAQRLVDAQQQAALLTTFNEVDMSAVIDFRRRYRDDFTARHGARLGFLSFFVKATIDALRRCPRLNAEISENDIVYRNYYDIGIAVSTDRGLMVPVLRSAEQMSFAEIETEIADFADRARNGRIQLNELQGGTFTITNGGIFGSLLSTPIINPPQSGVLGLHAIQDRPVVEEGQVVVKPMMYIALTYDHRIVDGREAVTFLVRIKEAIQEPARMLIEV